MWNWTNEIYSDYTILNHRMALPGWVSFGRWVGQSEAKAMQRKWTLRQSIEGLMLPLPMVSQTGRRKRGNWDNELRGSRRTPHSLRPSIKRAAKQRNRTDRLPRDVETVRQLAVPVKGWGKRSQRRCLPDKANSVHNDSSAIRKD